MVAISPLLLLLLILSTILKPISSSVRPTTYISIFTNRCSSRVWRHACTASRELWWQPLLTHLSCLLSWCDFRCKQPPPTLDNLTMTLKIIKKYDIDSIFEHAQKGLLLYEFLQSEPLRVFAIAIRFRLDNIAREAAQATLQVSLVNCNFLDLNTYLHSPFKTFTTTILSVRKLYEISSRVSRGSRKWSGLPTS